MKKCSRCLEVKESTEFSKDKSRKDGLQPNCKACKKQYMQQYRQENAESIKEQKKQWYQENVEHISELNKQWRESLKDGYHHVYILPIEHYAGTTDCIPNRMRQHKNNYGRNTEGHFIVGSYENRQDALNHESRLHDEGYNGRHSKNSYQ